MISQAQLSWAPLQSPKNGGSSPCQWIRFNVLNFISELGENQDRQQRTAATAQNYNCEMRQSATQRWDAKEGQTVVSLVDEKCTFLEVIVGSGQKKVGRCWKKWSQKSRNLSNTLRQLHVLPPLTLAQAQGVLAARGVAAVDAALDGCWTLPGSPAATGGSGGDSTWMIPLLQIEEVRCWPMALRGAPVPLSQL